MLAPIVVAHISNASPVLVSSRCRGKVLSTGSILHRMAEGDIVWGSGAIHDVPINPPASVTFRAVRGPLTRSLIQADVPEVYGDPAMLLPRIFAPRSIKTFRVGIVPHLKEASVVRTTDPSISMIDVLADWRSVVRRIIECEVILSSSLHGLIVAEAYGVPALWFSATDKVRGRGFKFRDYYLSTGREAPQPVPWSDSIASMTRRATEPPHVNTEPLERAWPEELTFPRAEGGFDTRGVTAGFDEPNVTRL
jgi:pyruvyltransferase